MLLFRSYLAAGGPQTLSDIIVNNFLNVDFLTAYDQSTALVTLML